MGTTENLELETFTPLVDPDIGFDDLRLNINGPTDSNMTKIDDYADSVVTLLSLLSTNTSASLVPLDTFIDDASGSVATVISASATIDTYFRKLGEYNGDGMNHADFISLSQDFSHLLLLGRVASNASGSLAGIGMDFNADQTAGHYVSTAWIYSGSAVPYVEGSSGSLNSFLSFGAIAGSLVGLNYGTTFFALIPYYSVNGGFNKTGVGFTTNINGTYLSADLGGGVWLNSSPITRIRVFSTDQLLGGSVYYFTVGTKISLYGII